MTDFDLIQSKVQAMFEKTNVAGEIVILQKLKRLFEEKQASSSEESKHVDLPAIMEQIESLVKTEAKKGSTTNLPETQYIPRYLTYFDMYKY